MGSEMCIRDSANTAVTAAGQLVVASPSSLGAALNTIVLEANYYWNIQGQGEAQLEFALEFPQGLNQEEALVLLGFTGQSWNSFDAFRY